MAFYEPGRAVTRTYAASAAPTCIGGDILVNDRDCCNSHTTDRNALRQRAELISEVVEIEKSQVRVTVLKVKVY